MRRRSLSCTLLFGSLVFLAAQGCHVIPRRAPALPGAHRVERGQMVVRSDFPLASKHRLLAELEQLGDRISDELALPRSDEPIHVYLFRDAANYYDFVHRQFPAFPLRRAFFIESDTRLNVYAHWGDHVAVDLRHEVAHGYLHSVVPDLPLWLDEGLAEYFELPRGYDGVHESHVRPRLESMQAVESMTQRDYAEAWAWVHLLLRGDPPRRSVLRQYLDGLRSTKSPEPLTAVLATDGTDDPRLLWEHLVEVAACLQPAL